MQAASPVVPSRGRIGNLLLRPSVRAAVCLAGILAGATWLRLSPITYDNPFVYHPDEWATAKPALYVAATGDLNPHLFIYPSFVPYAEAAVTEVVHAVSGRPMGTPAPTGYAGLPARSVSDFDALLYPYVAWGRRLVATLGVLTALLVALAGRAAVRRGQPGRAWLAGLAGAGFVALAVLPLDHSRYLTTDVPSGFWTAAVMAATLASLSRPPGRTADRLLILACFLAGLAGSTKYNAATVAVVPALAYLARAGSLRALPGWLRGVILSPMPALMALAAVAGFVVATPYAVLDTGAVVAAVSDQANHYGVAGHLGAQGDSAQYYVGYLWKTGFGPVLSSLALAGIAWAFVRRSAADLITVAFTVAYFVFVSLPTARFERNLMPLVPFVALLAGRFAADAALALADRIRPHSRPLAGVAAAGLVALLALQPLAAAIDDTQRAGLPDTRTIARQWIGANLPDGSTIVRESYTPQPDTRRYRVGFLTTLSNHDLAWYRDQGFRYAIVSDREYFRYSAPGHEREAAFYQELLSLPVVFSIQGSATAQGPRIDIVDLQLDP